MMTVGQNFLPDAAWGISVDLCVERALCSEREEGGLHSTLLQVQGQQARQLAQYWLQPGQTSR
jgi:hypothetical protein